MRQWRLQTAGHAHLALGADISGVRQAVRLHQQMIVLPQAGITGGPVHALLRQGLDGHALIHLPHFLPALSRHSSLAVTRGWSPKSISVTRLPIRPLHPAGVINWQLVP